MFLTRIKSVHFLKFVPTNSIFCRLASSECGKMSPVEDPIVLTNDGTMFVCWHPEKEFPYEFTRPMPERSSRKESVLKTSPEEAMKTFGNKRPDNEIRQQLAKLTHTTIHRWFPRNWDRRRQFKRIKADREHL